MLFFCHIKDCQSSHKKLMFLSNNDNEFEFKIKKKKWINEKIKGLDEKK